MGINTTVYETTKKSPSELLFGRKATNPSQGILKDVIEDVEDVIVDKTKPKKSRYDEE